MCENCGWADTMDKIDELLESDKAKFATDFLTSVREWIVKNEHVTEKQQNGVNNVEKAANKTKVKK